MRLKIIWAEPATVGLENTLAFIAADNPDAAMTLFARIIAGLNRISEHPASGRRLPEKPEDLYRELVVPPCRIIYKQESGHIVLLALFRSERYFDPESLE